MMEGWYLLPTMVQLRYYCVLDSVGFLLYTLTGTLSSFPPAVYISSLAIIFYRKGYSELWKAF